MFYTNDEAEFGADWIPAIEAVELATPSFEGSVQNAKAFLIRRAGADRIRTKCAMMRMEKRGGSSPTINERENCLISYEFWLEFESNATRTLEDWVSGDFERRKTGKYGSTDIVRLISGRFSKSDVFNELPIPRVEWINAHNALQLVAQSVSKPEAAFSICTRALAGLVRARAVQFSKDEPRDFGSSEQVTYRAIELPVQFWWARGHEALEQNWVTGDFFTWIDKTYHWQAFGVEFARGDIEAMLPQRSAIEGVRPDPEKHADIDQMAENATNLPSDEDIEAKMQELVAMPMKRDAAAKVISQITGFEAVGNDHARRTVLGKLPRGRPKTKGA
jgi:hypothetical protein